MKGIGTDDRDKFIGTPRKATTTSSERGPDLREVVARQKSLPPAELDVPAIDAASLLGGSVRNRPGPDAGAIGDPRSFRHFTRLSTWNYAIDLA